MDDLPEPPPDDPRRVLHDAARRYCRTRGRDCRERYDALDVAGLARPGAGRYSDAALDLFPRHLTMAAVLVDVERFAPSDFADEAELRDVLSLAAQTVPVGDSRRAGPVETAAVADERRRFADFLRTAAVADHLADPLPYRRVLEAEEATRQWAAFEAVWGRWHGGACDRADVPPHITLHVAAMGGPGVDDALRRALGIGRLLELREFGESYELDPAAATFAYDGAEGVWTPRDFGRMVYASHEASITLGGTPMIDAVRAVVNFERFAFSGFGSASCEL